MTVIQAALRVYKDTAGRDRLLWLLYLAAVPPSQGLILFRSITVGGNLEQLTIHLYRWSA
jgi:hypothetical protein